MTFNLNQIVEVLQRTPDVLESLLAGLSDSWIYTNEGAESWSPLMLWGILYMQKRQTGFNVLKLF